SARSCSRRCPYGSSTRSTSTRSCCSRWRSTRGRRTSVAPATTWASRWSAWRAWPTRTASPDSEQVDHEDQGLVRPDHGRGALCPVGQLGRDRQHPAAALAHPDDALVPALDDAAADREG